MKYVAVCDSCIILLVIVKRRLCICYTETAKQLVKSAYLVNRSINRRAEKKAAGARLNSIFEQHGLYEPGRCNGIFHKLYENIEGKMCSGYYLQCYRRAQSCYSDVSCMWLVVQHWFMKYLIHYVMLA